MVGATCACKFCGQVSIIGVSTPLDEDMAIEQGTRRCNCDEARRYKAAQDSFSALQDAFSEDDGYKPLDPDTQHAIIGIYGAVLTGDISKATIDTGDDVIRIKMGKLGMQATRERKIVRMY